VRLPSRVEPDPSRLLRLAGDLELPAELRDDAIARIALAARSRLAQEIPRERAPAVPAGVAARPIQNVVFVSHCDFTGNSALHVLAIASELYRRGRSPLIAVPGDATNVEEVAAPPPFPVLTYDDALAGRMRFPDGVGPDLVHAFTPRELVREVTVELVRQYRCPYLVHLEDNDEVVLSGELGGADISTLRALPLPVLDGLVRPRQLHPLRGGRFLNCAAGITVLIDRLLEIVPDGIPVAVVHAGFDEAVLEPRRPRDEVRTELGLGPEDLAIVYTGNVHSLNRDEMRELYQAVADLRARGSRIVLVKTGWGSAVAAASFPPLGTGLRDLGWVPRELIPDLLSAADVLVQPGGPNPFNDYRFPSKLPEYLAAGRPVVLPRTNVGLELEDGVDAVLLERGDASEIAAAVQRLEADPGLRERLGRHGREFALRELRWSAGVDRLEQLLDEIAASPVAPTPAWALEGADPPVKVIAIVSSPPALDELTEARDAGIFGYSLPAAQTEPPSPETGARFWVFAEHRVEPIQPVDDGYADAMRRWAMETPTERHTRVPVPSEDADLPLYMAWLRKASLQAALLTPVRPPLVLVDATDVWRTGRRRRWLEATGEAIREAIRQFYAAQGLAVADSEAALIIRST
jgi:glycosyltransferase involved in cell wall biosynthesis